jgi:hypothetical protein
MFNTRYNRKLPSVSNDELSPTYPKSIDEAKEHYEEIDYFLKNFARKGDTANSFSLSTKKSFVLKSNIGFMERLDKNRTPYNDQEQRKEIGKMLDLHTNICHTLTNDLEKNQNITLGTPRYPRT